jgi:dihydrofolate reductase
MRHVILQEFVSLDGLAAGPGGSVDFVGAASDGDQSFGKRQQQFIDTIDTILLGRKTYELFVDYWPKVTSGDEKPFADRLNAIPKVVFSKSLDRVPWGAWDDARVVRTDPAAEVARLKRQPGKNMVIWGSLSIAQSLLHAGGVDECHLVICPVVLGGGKPLFRESVDAGGLTLLKTQPFDRGTVLLAYAAARATAAARRSSDAVASS